MKSITSYNFSASIPFFKRNLELLDMMKTPLLMTYRAHVPVSAVTIQGPALFPLPTEALELQENQLYYLTQLHNVPQANNFFRADGVVPAF
ncbi:unnamed protein product [Heligmosomoides polygyrus]|uniref:Thymidylat_synt domain-containing protein n=1 Tax=Heligmosomoides polygyrus TaxID=6339 RepID=A0A183FK25_HELPZ|nr:unnamed protein product [Heligmosomoides polygyrus]